MSEVSSPKKVFVIAGEASGDVLGGGVMQALKEQDPNIEFHGIGGEFMQRQGLESLLPMNELCVMGLWEVLAQLPRLLKLVQGVVAEIEKVNPDVVLTIDLPDFNFRVAEILKKRGNCNAKVLHYVAPTVWAWRPGRAKKVAQYLDGMMCLFPFEPDYFKEHDLSAQYVGHPVIEQDDTLSGDGLRDALGIPRDAKVLGLYFGSRSNEVEVHGQIFYEALKDILEENPDLHIIVPTLPNVEFEVRELLQHMDASIYLISDVDQKWNIMAACDYAMAVSGTVGLELAYMNVPHVVGYKVKFATWLALRLLVKVKYAHLANILLDKEVVPEFLQKRCDPLDLYEGISTLLTNEEAVAAQKDGFSQMREKLTAGIENSPSMRAAEFVLKHMR